jgi:uncharacterized protein (DUF433 family)
VARYTAEGDKTPKHEPYTEPAYSLAEAARYLKLSPATLRSWFLGRDYPTARGMTQFAPVLRLAGKNPPALSFWNLIEAHVLRSLRTAHGIPLIGVRKALSYAERQLGIPDLLRREELRTSGKDLFLSRYGELINLSASGQLAMRAMLEAHLQRIEWGPLGSAIRLYPFLGEGAGHAKPILIDPTISFGRPVVRDAYISTRTIVDRIDAGEGVEEIARDYQVTTEAIEEAVLYERAA